MSIDYDMNPQPKSSKSYVVTLLLAFFLGELGIHRFYTGYITEGIIQLLTCGGCGIWSLIDIISLCTKNYVDSDGNELENYNPGCAIIAGVITLLSVVLIILSIIINGIIALG